MTDQAILCTHCQVAMTSWAAPGSPIRYYQCPFCARTHASCYVSEVRKGAGARRAAIPVSPASPEALPQASGEEIRWAGVKARAARWFARLEEEEAGHAPRPSAAPRQVPVRTAPAIAAAPVRHR